MASLMPGWSSSGSSNPCRGSSGCVTIRRPRTSGGDRCSCSCEPVRPEAATAYRHLRPAWQAAAPNSWKVRMLGAVRVLRDNRSHVAPRPDDPHHAVRIESLPLYRPELPGRVPGLHRDQAAGTGGLCLVGDSAGGGPPPRGAAQLAAGRPVPALLLRCALRRSLERQRLPRDVAPPLVPHVPVVLAVLRG